MYSASGCRCDYRTSGLHDCLEIFQLDEPDTGYDRFVDRQHVPLQREKELLAYRCACNLYERRIHDVFLLCRRMPESGHDGGVSGRNYSGGSIPWNLYACN